MNIMEVAIEQANRKKYSVARNLLGEIVRQNPDDVIAHYGLAQMCLMMGDFEEGFTEFEWRLKLDNHNNKWRNKAYDWSKVWDGSPLEDRTLLVFCEQGLGDGIQFVRYINQIEGKVVVHAHKPLAPLLNEETVVADIGTDEYKSFPSYDCVCSAMSLPYLLKDFTPSGKPYFFNESRSIKWKKKIGIVWGCTVGTPSEQEVSSTRSIPLDCFKRLPHSLYGLQVEARPDLGDTSWLCNLADNIFDLRDTVEIMQGMDLIITCDTSTAHLAGSLGCPCWVALPYLSDWRWGMKDTTPWYNSVRLFRQKEPGNWDTVFDEITRRLS